MMSNSVINRSSRATVEQYLTKVLSEWANEWFQCDFSLVVSFNDDLWKRSEKKKGDHIMVGPSRILLSDAEKRVEQLSQLAIKYDHQPHSEDEAFWLKLNQKIVNDLLAHLIPEHAQVFAEQVEGVIEPAVSVSMSIGSIDFTLSIDKKTFELSGAMTKPMPLKASRLTHLNTAIKTQTLALTAGFRPLNTTLKDILELKKGDVIKLDHGLQSPIIVEGKDGRVPLGAFLVKQEKTKALLITGKEN